MREVVPNAKGQHRLEPKTSPARRYPILAYDVETDSDGNFVYAHVYGERTKLQPKTKKKLTEQVDIGCHTMEELQRAIAGPQAYKRFLAGKEPDKNNSVPCILVAYNYRYDFPYILPIVDDTCTLWGSGGFIAGRLKTGAKMIDLTNHTQKRSLEEIIKVMGLEAKGIVKHDLEDDPTKRDVRCRDDARSTYELGKALQEFYASRWNVDLAPTIAGQAMLIYRAGYFQYYFVRKGADTQFNTLERKAYYGGRTECFRRGCYEVHSFDVKSMYPSVMRDNLMPHPNSAQHVTEAQYYRQVYESDRAGIFHVRVHVPKGVVGLLPHHNKAGRLVFPHGTFEGWYVKEELQAAERYGAKILHCYEFIVYTTKVDLFSGYITDMFESRRQYESGTLYNMMYKLLMNSLYGKFAQKNPVNAFTGKLEDYDGAMPEGLDISHCYSVMGEDCINIPATHYEEAYGAFPCIAVYITALARIKLLNKLMQHRESVVYCDTDSIKYQSWDAKDEDGHELGEWEYEYTKTQVFVRPKLYWDLNMASIKAKGIKMGGFAPLVWDRLPTPEEDMMPYTVTDKNGRKVTVPLSRITVISADDEGLHARFYKPTGIKEGITRKVSVNQWTRHEKLLEWGDTKRTWVRGIQLDDTRQSFGTSESFPALVTVPYARSYLRTYMQHRPDDPTFGGIFPATA